MQLQFLGATGTVTGSRYLLNAGGSSILVDCGLFQGYKQLRLRNRAPLPVEPSSLDAVVLTHAHLDHSGYIPLLVKNGFRGKIYCSSATFDLCKIMLPDSGRLLEEEAFFANRHGYSKHDPALPLYTEDDALHSLRQFSPVPFSERIALSSGLHMRMVRAGHILGAATISFDDGHTTLTFSGDLGRPGDPVLPAPSLIEHTDYLVVESTYGNRKHDPENPMDTLAEIIRRTAARGGVVIIPSFAVGRAQMMLYYLHRLKEEGKIPHALPVYLNSPMAADATALYSAHYKDHKLSRSEYEAICRSAKVVNSVEESKALNERRVPMVIIAASGMATGGRVLHHLKAFAPDSRNTILFAGFQAGGTRGAAMVGGATSVKIHGEYVPVRAKVIQMENLSAHADADEILGWLGGFKKPPKMTFITHGEADAADALRVRINERLKWNCCVPEYLQEVTLD